MGRIQNIQKERTIDYSKTKLEYFTCESNDSNLVSYETIINKIKDAKNFISIASTSKISDEIIDALYHNNGVDIYMILKSFEEAKDTLERFDSKFPAIIRNVDELENNFIIIDNISYLLVNSLSNKQNIVIDLDEEQTTDLKYWFNYYFWDKASKEKIVDVDKDDKPKESPFPKIGIRELEKINIYGNRDINFNSIYIPRDKKYDGKLDSNIEDRYIGFELESIVYIDNDLTRIGTLLLKDCKLDINNRWKLKEHCLFDIDNDTEIIPRAESWDKLSKLSPLEEIDLGIIQSDLIERIQEIEPSEFKQRKYVKEIKYKWKVKAPHRSSDSKKSNLYNEYQKLNEEYQKQLVVLENKLDNLIKESSGLLSVFSGANKKAKDKLKIVESYKIKDLKKLTELELDENLKSFELFKSRVFDLSKSFSDDKKKQIQKEKWEDEKEQKEKSLEKKEKELLEVDNKLKESKEKTREFTKINKEKNKIEQNIDFIQKEIEDKYREFIYNPKENEIKNFNKNRNPELKKLIKPRYILPEVGTLYESKNSYYLEIEEYRDLDIANELKQRYVDKRYKVVGINEKN